MSTKTTFKRISLVAVAALGFGVLSVVPSTAATTLNTVTLTNTSAIAPTSTSAAVAVSSAATFTITDAFSASAVPEASVITVERTTAPAGAFEMVGST